MKTRLYRISGLIALVVALTVVAGCSGSGGGNGGSAAPDQESPAAQLTRQKCTMCHTFDRVEQANKDSAGWEETVSRMQQNGLVVTEEEKQQIIGYLVESDAQ